MSTRRRILLFRLWPNTSGTWFMPNRFVYTSDRVAFSLPDWTMDPRIAGDADVVVERSVSCWPFGGGGTLRPGSVTLLNGDRAHDWLLGLSPRIYRYELRWCWDDEAASPSYSYESTRVWQAGVIDGVSADDSARRIVITLADPLAALDAPVQTLLYPDDAPNAALAGKPRPICIGEPRFVPGVLRSTATSGADANVYDWRDRDDLEAVGGPILAYDRGDQLAMLTDVDYTPDLLGIKLANVPDRPVCMTMPAAGLTIAGADVIVGGTFLNVAGAGRNRAARLGPAGTALAFNPNPNGAVNALALQADGKVLIGGAFSVVKGISRPRITRLNADGTLDVAFSTWGANSTVNAIAVSGAGDIHIGGLFTQAGGVARTRYAQLNADGTPNAAGAAIAPDSTVTAVALWAGRVVIGGSFATAGGLARARLARIHADGTLDTVWNPGTNAQVNALAVDASLRLYVAGSFTAVGGVTRNRLARFNADGTLDSTFAPNIGAAVNALAVQQDGKIIIGGSFTVAAGVTRARLARLNPDGTLDAGFDPPAFTNPVSAVAVHPDGRIVVGGVFSTVGGAARPSIVRLMPDGTVDPTFTATADGAISALVTADSAQSASRLPGFVTAVLRRAAAAKMGYAPGAPLMAPLDSVYPIDVPSVAALDAAAPYALAHWTAEPQTALSILRRALDGWCGWLTARRDGTLVAGRLQPRGSATGALRLDSSNILSVRRRRDDASGLTKRLAGRRTHTVHSDSDIATSVTPAMRAELQTEWTTRSATASLGAYPHAAGAAAQDTYLQSAADLQTEIDRVAALFNAGQLTWCEIDAALPSDAADALEPGDWVHVTHPSTGLDGGVWLCLMGLTIRFRARRVTLQLLQLPEVP